MDERMQAQAAEAARQVLSDFRAAHPDWQDDRTPVDDVASWYGLEVETFSADDYPKGTYGFFEAEENLVWLCRGLSPTFRRFTLAHELGHAVLHRSDGYRAHSQLSIPNSGTSWENACQVPDVREEVTALGHQQQAEELLGPGVAYDPRSQRELAANIFAAELLMPLERVCTLYLSSHLPPSQLTVIFEVSQAAMLNRLAGLLREPVNLTEQPPPRRPNGDHSDITRPIASKKRYDEFQQAAIEAPTPALIVAGPGSGKTSTLIGRAEYLIAKLGVQPQHILALTFSRKAAGEMQERLQTILNAGSIPPTVSTFHAFCAELLRTYGNLVGLRQDFTFVDDVEGYFLLRRLAAELPLHHYQNLATPTMYFPAILGAISRAKDELVTPQEYESLALRMLEQARSDEDIQSAEKALEIAAIYTLYQQRLQRQGDIDFGGLIMLAVQLLKEHPDIGNELQQQYQHILVDEFQDINRASGVLLRLLAGEQCNVWVVGDANQCQPVGTMIRLPDGSESPIEKLQPNSEVVTYDRDSTMFVKKGKVTDVAVRPYNGMLYTVKVGDKQTRCTDTHKWLVRWTNTEQEVWITYLMRQGNRYRVGQTQLFLKARAGKRKSNGDLSLALRVRKEKAEAAWILKVHDTYADALVYEQILSATYGLPEVVFTQSYGSKCFTQEMIDKIYNSLSSLEDAARRCLADHGRKLEYPLYTREGANGVQNGERQRQGRTTIFEAQACNLITGFMAIPVAPTHIHSKRDHSMRRVVAESWQPVEVTCEPFSGPVYSLNVAKHHKYIADGLVTCNSIYGFRGASPANIGNFKDDYPDAIILPLNRNYRSRPDIVSLAHTFRHERLEPGTNSEEPGNVQTARSSLPDAYVTLAVAANEASELNGLVDDIRRKHTQGYSFRDIVVLCRTRAQARKITQALAKADLPVSERGSMLEQEHIKSLLSIVMLLADSSGMGILRAARQPDHALGQDDIEALILAAREQKCTLVDLILRDEAPITLSAAGCRSLTRLSVILKTLWRTTSVWSMLAAYLLLETSLVRDLLCSPAHPQASAVLSDYAGILQLARYYDQQQQTLYTQEAFERGEDVPEPPPIKEQAKGFLDYLSVLLTLRQDGGNRREGGEGDNEELPDAIRVMTVHASKGLEFPVVYLPYLVSRRFPMQKRAQTAPAPRGMLPPECEGDAAHESGEACLFYVGATRARDQLVLSYSERYGKVNYKRSPYIDALVTGLPQERITRLAWQDHSTSDQSVPDHRRVPARGALSSPGGAAPTMHDGGVGEEGPIVDSRDASPNPWAVQAPPPHASPLPPLLGTGRNEASGDELVSSQPGESFIEAMQPETLSISAIENYATCPRRYAYSSIYHFHLEEGAYQLFWQATRKTLDALQKSVEAGKQSADQEGPFLSQQEAEELFTQHWQERDGHTFPFASLYEQHGREVAELLRRKLLESSDGDVQQQSRQSYSVTIAGRTIEVHIDSVEVAAQGEKPIKFIRRRFGKRKDRPVPGTRELLYTHASRQHHPGQSVELHYHNMSTGETFEVKLTEKKEQSLYNELEQAIAGLERHEFPPKPDAFICPTCPFFLICPA